MKRNIIKKIGTVTLTSVTVFSLGSKFDVFAGAGDKVPSWANQKVQSWANQAEQNLKGEIERFKLDIDNLYKRIIENEEEIDEDLKREIREVKKVEYVLGDDDEDPGINQNITTFNAWYRKINGKSEDFENEENSNITSYNTGVSRFENYDGEEKAYLLKVRLFEDGREENIIIREINKNIEKLNEKINGYKYFTIDELGKRIDDLYARIVEDEEEVNEEVKKEIRDLKDMLFLQNRRIKGCVYHDNKRKNITRSEEYSKINSYNIGISSWVKSCNGEERVHLLKFGLFKDDREENNIIRDKNPKIEEINEKVNGYYTIEGLSKEINNLYKRIVENGEEVYGEEVYGEEVYGELEKEVEYVSKLIHNKKREINGRISNKNSRGANVTIVSYNQELGKHCGSELAHIRKVYLCNNNDEANIIIEDMNEKIEKINEKVNGFKFEEKEEFKRKIEDDSEDVVDCFKKKRSKAEREKEEYRQKINKIKEKTGKNSSELIELLRKIAEEKEDGEELGIEYDDCYEMIVLLRKEIEEERRMQKTPKQVQMDIENNSINRFNIASIYKEEEKETREVKSRKYGDRSQQFNRKIWDISKEEFKGMKRHQARELPTKQEMSRRFESQIEMNRRFESQIEKGNNGFNIGKQPEMKEMKKMKEIKEIKEKKGMKKLSKVSEKKKVKKEQKKYTKRVEATEEDDSKEEIIDLLAKKREKERKEMEEEFKKMMGE